MKNHKRLLTLLLVLAAFVAAITLSACNKAKKVEVTLDYGFKAVAPSNEAADTTSSSEIKTEELSIDGYKKLSSVTSVDEGFGDGALLSTRQYYLLMKVTVVAREDNIAEKLNVIFKIKNNYKVYNHLLLEGTSDDGYSGVKLTEQDLGKDVYGYGYPISIQDKKDEAPITKYFLFKIKPEEINRKSDKTDSSETLSFDISYSGENLKVIGSGADGLKFGPDVEKGRLDAPEIKIIEEDPSNPNKEYQYFEFANVKYSNYYIIYIGGQAYATITKETVSGKEQLVLRYNNWNKEGQKPLDAPSNWANHGESLMLVSNPKTITLQLLPGSKTYKVAVDAGQSSDIYDGNESQARTIIGKGKIVLSTPVLRTDGSNLIIDKIDNATTYKLYSGQTTLLFTITLMGDNIGVINYPNGTKDASYPSDWQDEGSVINTFINSIYFQLLSGNHTYMLIVEGTFEYTPNQSEPLAVVGA